VDEIVLTGKRSLNTGSKVIQRGTTVAFAYRKTHPLNELAE